MHQDGFGSAFINLRIPFSLYQLRERERERERGGGRGGGSIDTYIYVKHEKVQ